MKIYTNELGHITKYYHGCSNYHTGSFYVKVKFGDKAFVWGKKDFFF